MADLQPSGYKIRCFPIGLQETLIGERIVRLHSYQDNNPFLRLLELKNVGTLTNTILQDRPNLPCVSFLIAELQHPNYETQKFIVSTPNRSLTSLKFPLDNIEHVHIVHIVLPLLASTLTF